MRLAFAVDTALRESPTQDLGGTATTGEFTAAALALDR
jgi:hypothetical protein